MVRLRLYVFCNPNRISDESSAFSREEHGVGFSRCDHFDHLAKVESAKFLHCKCIIFHAVINK